MGIVICGPWLPCIAACETVAILNGSTRSNQLPDIHSELELRTYLRRESAASAELRLEAAPSMRMWCACGEPEAAAALFREASSAAMLTPPSTEVGVIMEGEEGAADSIAIAS
jgi:hypothetical protein